VLTEDGFLQRIEVGRSAVAVDAFAIRSGVHLDDARVEVTQDVRRDRPRCPVCAVDDDLEAGEVDIIALDRSCEERGVARSRRL
jgi:hypothetical protein